MSVRVLVLRTAGTNCDFETARAFELAGAHTERLHVQVLLDRARRLDEFHVLALPGGFSYGDDLGAGTILANALRTRLRDALESFVQDGRQVLGICNGFQVLARIGLLPEPGGEPLVSLVENSSGLFEDRWVTLRVETSSSPVLQADELFEMPVAHMEGRLMVRDPEVLEMLKERDQIAFRYVGRDSAFDGERAVVDEDPGYPANPNGSLEAIAGIQSPCGNVLGLMPHPERHVRALHHPEWTRRVAGGEDVGTDWRQGDGFRIFARAVTRAQETVAG